MLVAVPLAGKKRARDGADGPATDDDDDEPVKKQARGVGQEIIDEMRGTPLLLELPVELLHLILDPDHVNIYLLMTRVAAVNTELRGHVATLLARVFEYLIVRDLEMMQREHLVLRDEVDIFQQLRRYRDDDTLQRIYCLVQALAEVSAAAHQARAIYTRNGTDGIAMFNDWGHEHVLRARVDDNIDVWLDARTTPRSEYPDVSIVRPIPEVGRPRREATIRTPIVPELRAFIGNINGYRAEKMLSLILCLCYPFASVRSSEYGRQYDWTEHGYSMDKVRVSDLPLAVANPIRVPEPLHPRVTTWATSIPDARFPGRMKVHVSEEDLAAAVRALLYHGWPPINDD